MDKKKTETQKETAIVKATVNVGPQGIQLRTLDEMWRMATAVLQSGVAPKALDNVAAIVVAMQTGMEAGLTPMQSLNSVYVVNGRAALFGDAPLGLVRRSGLLVKITEKIINSGDERIAVCIAIRKGQTDTIERRFSVADAKQAKLWDREIWKKYPERMLQMRARSLVIRDGFSDVTMGIPIAEEFMGSEPEYKQEIKVEVEKRDDRVGDVAEDVKTIDIEAGKLIAKFCILVDEINPDLNEKLLDTYYFEFVSYVDEEPAAAYKDNEQIWTLDLIDTLSQYLNTHGLPDAIKQLIPVKPDEHIDVTDEPETFTLDSDAEVTG